MGKSFFTGTDAELYTGSQNFSNLIGESPVPYGLTTAQATIYTTLFDVKTARPVWTFNPPTYNPSTLQQDAPRYANDVAGLLQSSGLLAGR